MTLAKPDSDSHLCKHCAHCEVIVEHGLHSASRYAWETALCAKTGKYSYVTGRRIEMQLCQHHRQRLGTPTCPDFEEKTK